MKVVNAYIIESLTEVAKSRVAQGSIVRMADGSGDWQLLDVWEEDESFADTNKVAISISDSVTDGTIPLKEGTIYVDSSITETEDSVSCSKAFFATLLETLSSSAIIGSNTLSSNTEGMETKNGITEQRSILVQSRYCSTCSDMPYYPKLGEQLESEISLLTDIVLPQENSFTYIVDTDIHNNSIILNPAETGTLQVIIKDNATELELYRIYDYEVTASMVDVELPLSAEVGGQSIIRAGTTIYVETSGVSMNGHQYVSDVDFGDQKVPYFKSLGQAYSEELLATQAYAVAGTEAEDWSSLDESSAGYSWTDKLSVTSETKPAGRYRVGFTCEITESSSSEEVRFMIDGATIHNHTTGNDELEPELEDSNWTPVNRFCYLTTTTDRTIDLAIQHKDSGTGKMSNARIEIWRVS